MRSIESLRTTQENLLRQINDRFFRFLFSQIDWDQRLVAIKGPRGTGKTTLMLQHLKYKLDRSESLYASADHPYFYTNSFFDLAEEWSLLGGKCLLLDEVHKQSNWSREIKSIYDSFPELKVIFSSSSALDLYRGEGDLSRRLSLYNLPGFSFREYLAYMSGIYLDTISLEDLLKDHEKIAVGILDKLKPIPAFREYLKTGYFPFSRGLEQGEYLKRLQAVLNTVLEVDLAHIQGYSASNTAKIKRLLGTIAELVPFEPNVSRLASKMQLGRETVINYLQHLKDARILNFLYREQRSISQLQKPKKIYIENTNLSYALKGDPDPGTLRETFVLSQMMNAEIEVSIPSRGDLLIQGDIHVEIGGRNKTFKQLKDTHPAFLIKDDIEYGFGNTIPIWLIGFLY